MKASLVEWLLNVAGVACAGGVLVLLARRGGTHHLGLEALIRRHGIVRVARLGFGLILFLLGAVVTLMTA
jgi:hypothetical protein